MKSIRNLKPTTINDPKHKSLRLLYLNIKDQRQVNIKSLLKCIFEYIHLKVLEVIKSDLQVWLAKKVLINFKILIHLQHLPKIWVL